MKYAITGAAGFIGRHAVASFIQMGYRVVLIDVPQRLPTAAEEFVDGLGSLGYKLGRNSCDLVESRPCNLLGDYNVGKLLEGCDVVVHLAGLSNPREAIDNPQMATRVNSGITQRLLDSGRRFVLASTYLLYRPRTAEFRPSEKTPIDDNDLHPYEKSKLEAERLVSSHRDYLILRFANNYGPGQAAGFLVPDVIQRIKDSQDSIKIYGPDSVRDLIFVQDTVSALIYLISGGYTGIFNIGTGKGHSIRHVNEVIGRQLGKGSLEFQIENDEKTFLVADITKIQEIGWQSSTSLEQGIEITLR